MSVLIYLDVCCLNHPFDNQTQERVRLESEAVLLILGRCQRGEWQLVGSEAIALEINQTRDSERKSQLRALADLATLHVTKASRHATSEGSESSEMAFGGDD